MFVVLVYDIQVKRISKIRKICLKYLRPVQKSVFEGVLTEAKLKEMQYLIENRMNPEEDAVCIYRIGSIRYARKSQIGKHTTVDNII